MVKKWLPDMQRNSKLESSTILPKSYGRKSWISHSLPTDKDLCRLTISSNLDLGLWFIYSPPIDFSPMGLFRFIQTILFYSNLLQFFLKKNNLLQFNLAHFVNFNPTFYLFIFFFFFFFWEGASIHSIKL